MDITSICRSAWNASKGASQPDYDDLVEAYRSMLSARAEGVIATGTVSGDAPFHAFESAVLSQGVATSKDAITEIDNIIPLAAAPNESEYQVAPEGVSYEIDSSLKLAGIDTTITVTELAVEEPPKPKKKSASKKTAKKTSPKVAVKKVAKKKPPKK